MKIQNILFKALIIVVLVFSYGNTIAQNTNIGVVDSTGQNANKWKIGVGFGLNFVGGTNVSLAPNITYMVSDKISIGAGIQGSYAAIKDVQSTTTYGANVIGQYSPITKLTTLLEFAELNVNRKIETPTGSLKEENWESVLFLGAGFNITNKISVGAKYNVLYSEDESVYTSPIIPFVNISF